MRFVFIILFFIGLFSFDAYSFDLKGTWQGVIIKAGQKIEKGTLLYVEFDVNGNSLAGKMREEMYETEFFAVKKIKGEINETGLSFDQIVIEKSNKTSRQKWCMLQGELTYDEKTGYLTGNYKSSDCRRGMGKIILYRSDFDMTKSEEMTVSHIWFDRFVKDYNLGLSAPEIRDLERKNFVFEPVFFDFDKSIIRKEHYAFLDRLVKVLQGHSDLRLLVIGHTDSDGSDSYNDKLSKARAEAIIAYFTKNGLNRDRLEFDFKGEHSPIDSNKTSSGKQRNRRVDFKFI